MIEIVHKDSVDSICATALAEAQAQARVSSLPSIKHRKTESNIC